METALKSATQPVIDIAKSGVTQAELKSRATKDYEHANRQLLAVANDNPQHAHAAGFTQTARVKGP